MTAKRQYRILGGAMMAAALVLGMTACSGEESAIEEKPVAQQPAQTAATIHVTVGAGISDPTPDPSPTREGSSATTRSTVDYTGGTRTLKFSTGDKLYVWGSYGSMESEPSGTEYYDYIVAGYLALDTESFDDSDPTNATFTGELTVYSWVNEEGHDEVLDEEAGDVQYMVDENGYYTSASSSPSFSTADPLGECSDVTGTLIHEGAVEGVDYFITEDERKLVYRPDCAATVEELMTTQLWVSGEYDSGTKSFALTKDTDQPIVNCTISGLEADVSYKVDYIYGATAAMDGGTRTLAASMEATGGTLAFAFIAATGDKFHGIRLTNTADAGDTYDVSIGQKEFESKVYNLSRRFVNLASVTKTTHPEGLTLENGDIVRGTLDALGNSSQILKISIAAGATVTLDGVDIRGRNSDSYLWAGLTCLGDATIILAVGSENTVKGFYNTYPGISIAYGYTLNIQGSGTLTASPYDGGTNDSNGAGIGGAYGVYCGNIVIEGGSINATGGKYSAGIGCGQYGECGDICISGGNVTATGGNYAAGIGCGQDGDCGNISISGGTVNATGGSGAGIGSGSANNATSTCGNITISGTANVTATGRSSAGIGCGQAGDCGDISISGSANVTATGGNQAAGIGSCYKGTVSGSISIAGGSVTAEGGEYAAAIGSGYEGSCGAIVIGSGITQVIAKRYGSYYNFFGAGSGGGTCDGVTIDGVENATTSSTFPHLTSTVTNHNNTWTLTNPSN